MKKTSVLFFLFFFFFFFSFTVPFVEANGILKGIVVNSEKSLVPHATLQFDCVPKTDAVFQKETDAFGSFRIEQLPKGECDISARSNNKAGVTTTLIQEDTIARVVITLDQHIVEEKKAGLLFFFSVISVMLYSAGYLISNFFRVRARKKSEKKEEQREKSNATKEVTQTDPLTHKTQQSRLDTVLFTLQKNEKDIIHYLREQKNMCVQATLRHALHIPRTTLSRTLEHLAAKQIIALKKEGKAIKITFTDWILEKNEKGQ